MRHVAVIACLVALLVAGCGSILGPIAGDMNVPVEGWDCADMPSGACDEQARQLTAAAGGQVRNISFECRIAKCTRAVGAGTALITMADGRTVSRTWSYVGDPNPPPVPTCVGIAFDVCREQVSSLVDNVVPSHHVVAVTVTCSGHCDASGGEVEVDFVSADGTHDTMGSGWGNSP